jgi:outer membrane receptor protein involved in Fe transport
MKLDFRQRLLATTLLVGASTLASPALAQPTPPATPNPPDNSATPTAPETTTPQEGQTTVPSTNAQGGNVRSSQDIVITGTRIPQPNLTSASPVTVLSSQEIKLQGTTRTEDLINSLPQSFAAQGSNISNGSTGTASVNLRGLGSARTLVLINGRRMQPGDPRQGSVADINFVPAALIKRVDVLTGGASSVYGADAVAGVVNFIMDTNFNGLRIDAQASTYMHSNRAGQEIIGPNEDLGFRPPHGLSTNGGAQDIAAAFGTSFADNRGHIMAYATYRTQDAVLEASRDYSFCSLGSNPPAYSSEFYCGGSSTNALGRFRALNPVTGVGRLSYTLGGNGNEFVPGFALFNFAPYNYFQRPDERYTFGTFAEYEISPGAKPYLEAMFMDDHSVSQIAPSGDFGNTLTINCDNPLMSAQQLALVCFPANEFVNPDNGVTYANLQINRRNVEGGGRRDDLEHTAWRVVGGVKGDLLRGLSYDAYYQFGTTRLAQTYLNDFSVRRLNQALDVVLDGNGVPVCRGSLSGSADAGCAPYNVFQIGGVTPEALAFLATPGFLRGHVNETIADANMTLEGGEYGLQTPWSDRGVGLNVGAEYRKEALETQTDTEFQTGDLAGQGGPTIPVAGSFDVRELFGEVQVPIVSHSFIEELSVTGGYRYSDYKVAGNHFSTNTYKVAAEFAPIRDIRMRGSYNRAVRAPNVVELFSAQALGLAGGTDPCAGATPVYSAAQCANTGVTAAQYGLVDANPANQYNAIFGGNPNLSPEKADTYTAGVVLQPRWVPGLAVTVDYFNIKVKGLIGTLSLNNVLNQCATTGNAQFCGLIHRDIFGSLTDLPTGFVTLTNQNIGGLQTKGFDINGSYAHRFGGLGSLSISYVATFLRKLSVDTGINTVDTGGTDGVYDCAGFFGATCTGGSPFTSPNPKYRHKLRVGFTLPNGLGISGQWRYFSKVRNDTLSGDPDLNGGGGPTSNPGDAVLPSQSFFDLALTARLADRYNFRVGANNIFDRSPPVAGGGVVGAPFGNGNTFPQMYDALGRFIFAGVTVDF